MRTLIRWAARLYPPAWRNRYAAEFDALLDDISPSFRDVCDVLGDVLRVRATTSIHACLMLAPVSPMNLRLPVVASYRTRSDDNHRPVCSLGSRNHDAVACSCAVASACPGTTTPSHRRSRFSKRIDVVLFAAA